MTPEEMKGPRYHIVGEGGPLTHKVVMETIKEARANGCSSGFVMMANKDKTASIFSLRPEWRGTLEDLISLRNAMNQVIARLEKP